MMGYRLLPAALLLGACATTQGEYVRDVNTGSPYPAICQQDLSKNEALQALISLREMPFPPDRHAGFTTALRDKDGKVFRILIQIDSNLPPLRRRHARQHEECHGEHLRLGLGDWSDHGH
jgi:hypothetical protein